jgi:serine phosphatase RsbU (regulator of sigma subunit)
VKYCSDSRPGRLLGLIDVSEYDAQRTTLTPGDAIVAYTDGVGEALDEKGDFFIIEGLVETLARAPRGATRTSPERC